MREILWEEIAKANMTCFRCGKPAEPKATVNFGNVWVYCCEQHGIETKTKLDILRGKHYDEEKEDNSKE